MKRMFKFTLLTITAALMFVIDMEPQPTRMPLGYQLPISLDLMTEAEAVMGRQRRTRRRGVAVGYSAGKASGAAAATSTTTTTTAAQPAPAQPTNTPPVGSIVTTLPDGCSTITMSGVQYNKCGNTYYRAAFQGNNLVYVVSQP